MPNLPESNLVRHVFLSFGPVFTIGREKPGQVSEVAQLISQTLEQERRQRELLEQHYAQYDADDDESTERKFHGILDNYSKNNNCCFEKTRNITTGKAMITWDPSFQEADMAIEVFELPKAMTCFSRQNWTPTNWLTNSKR
uniref:Uncharacterized protein n=1 Tax=Sphaerodactylus townsendi TaxID=933632 RepID=A0ACB8FVL0_9SAUR